MKLKEQVREKTLPNGLQVLLIHKPGYQKSLFLAGFGAGGMNIAEQQDGVLYTNPSGCAHFLEHQMFRLNGRDVSADFARMQANANAFTSYQETAYYFHTTADPLPPLALLLDFVQTLDITEASIEKEKGIILSEYNMYEQQPENRLFQEIFKSLYAHYPMNIDILGTPEAISNMKLEDLARFYSINYDPSKMILIGMTGHELDPVMEFIEEHEKAYPAKNTTRTVRTFETEPETVNRPFHTLEMDVAKPYICIGLKLKPSGDEAENRRRDILVNLWLDACFTAANPDYQKWLDDRIISQSFGAEADFSPQHAYMLFYAQTDKPEEFKKLVLDAVKEKWEVDEETFQSLRIPAVARSLRLPDQFENMAIELLHNRLAGTDMEEILSIPETVTRDEMAKALECVTSENVAIVTILPKKEAVQV